MVRNVFHSVLVFSIIAVSGTVAAAQKPIQDFDTMGDVNCESEMARLDNFAVQLLEGPATRGVIIFYGGVRFRGRLPKRGEAAGQKCWRVGVSRGESGSVGQVEGGPRQAKPLACPALARSVLAWGARRVASP